MTRKEYMQPIMQMVKIQSSVQILAGSVKTTGLDDPPIPGGSGDIGGAASRRRNRNDWDDEEEEDW